MTSRRPYWCPKTMKWQPFYWCLKRIYLCSYSNLSYCFTTPIWLPVTCVETLHCSNVPAAEIFLIPRDASPFENFVTSYHGIKNAQLLFTEFVDFQRCHFVCCEIRHDHGISLRSVQRLTSGQGRVCRQRLVFFAIQPNIL